MRTTIFMWLTQPGNDVICTENQWTTQPISYIDEEKWFEALEMGIFAEEWNRLAESAWVNHIDMAHSLGDLEMIAGR